MQVSKRSQIKREFEGAELGDERLSRRLVDIAGRMCLEPDRGIPRLMASEAQLEATYRFIGNERVSPEQVMGPHVAMTQKRAAAAQRVIIAHDRTTFCFAGETRREGLGRITGDEQGFLAQVSLAVSDEGCPLGVTAVQTWNRPTGQRKRRKPQPMSGAADSENARWWAGCQCAQAVLSSHNDVVHVIDRDADSYTLYHQLDAASMQHVVRSCHRRRCASSTRPTIEPLSDVVAEHSTVKLTRQVQLSRRGQGSSAKTRKSYPARRGRKATLQCSACTVTLHRPHQCDKALAPTLQLNVVEVNEVNVADGLTPVHWRLLTNLPVDTADDVAAVVDAYRCRWMIEEYFKAIKTGCSFEKRQFDSYKNLVRALAIFLPIAWQLLWLRFAARQHPDQPASSVLPDVTLTVLRYLVKKRQHRDLPDPLTVHHAMMAIASLGGHLKRNGPPGWSTLGLGWDRLLVAQDLYIDMVQM